MHAAHCHVHCAYPRRNSTECRSVSLRANLFPWLCAQFEFPIHWNLPPVLNFMCTHTWNTGGTYLCSAERAHTPLFMTPFIYYSLSHKTTSHKWTFQFDGMQHSIDEFSWSKIAIKIIPMMEKHNSDSGSYKFFLPVQVIHLTISPRGFSENAGLAHERCKSNGEYHCNPRHTHSHI